MTVIATAVTETSAYMLSDTSVSQGGGLIVQSRLPKVRKFRTPFGDVCIGVAGDAGICNILTFLSAAPARKKGESRLQYFLDSLPQSWRRGILMRGGDLGSQDMEVLLSLPGEIWVYDNTLAADLVQRDTWAVGSGGHIAIGAMASSPLTSPVELLIEAVTVASELMTDVGPCAEEYLHATVLTEG